MRKEITVIFGLFMAVLLIGLVTASINIGNKSHSIETRYGPSQNILGWINVSFSNELSTSKFIDSLNHQISLIDLIKQNPFYNYTCSPSHCETDYSPSAELTDSLNENGEHIIGMSLTGEISEIREINMDITSLVSSTSCSNQLKVDFFNDGIIEFSNNKSSIETCPGTKTYGCYNTLLSAEETSIDNVPFCQRITLPEAPGFELGAWVKKYDAGRVLTMSLYDSEGYEVENGECTLPDASTSGGEISCVVNHTVTNSSDYYVCLGVKSGTGNYKTKGYGATIGDVCGFYNYPSSTENAAYWIFAYAKKFAPVSNIQIRNTLTDGDDLAVLTEEYLNNRYGNLNCSNGCSIPIKIISNEEITTPEIYFQNIEIEYAKTLGLVTSNKLYFLTETPSKINSKFGKLNLDVSGLKVRDYYGNFTYKLEFEDKTVFSERLSVEQAPLIKGISPTSTAYAFPTKFALTGDNLQNVKSFFWDFGDNSTETTTVNSTTHVYADDGQYNLIVMITDNNGIKSSKSFTITVSSPKELINTTLKKMRKDLDLSDSQIKNFSLTYRPKISELINIEKLKANVSSLESKYNLANESDYPGLVSQILSLKVPEKVQITKLSQDYTLFPQEENVNLELLRNIGGGNYEGQTQEYIDAVVFWNLENIDITGTLTQFSATYYGSQEILLTGFELELNEKTSLQESPYFVLENTRGIEFYRDYDQIEEEGYSYLQLPEGGMDIILITSENLGFEDLPIFISPVLSSLPVEEPPVVLEPDKFKWPIYITIIIFLLIVAFIVYLWLQSWYKKKYESHLFKNNTDLYNLYHYIEAQRGKGVEDGEISHKLKKSGWSSEQVRFAMRKHSNKLTGMLEIPIEKLLKIFSKKETK